MYFSIYLFAGHGSAGLASFWDGDSKTYLVGSRSSNSSKYYALDNLDLDSLSTMRIMAFVGCKTGNTSASNGNLLDSAVNMGADCALGFTNTIYHPAPGETFVDVFTDKLVDGYSVSWAAASAKSSVLISNNQYYGYDSYVFEGSDTTF